MGNAASHDSIAVDETIHAMNARLPTLIDQTLGFGVLGGAPQQQLIALPVSPVFSPHAKTFDEFKSVENTATTNGAMDWEVISRTVPLAVDVGVQNRAHAELHTVREESVVVFHYQRIIAKRSMPVPRFQDLRPVRQRRYVDGNRWIVELDGNEICTTEYYGGEATIALRWNHDATTSTAAHADADVENGWILGRAEVRGFQLPNRVGGTLTTPSGVMELICALNKLPIECAVPVRNDAIPIRNEIGFPLHISVETHIRHDEILQKLTKVQLELRMTEPVNERAYDFVTRLKLAVEDASTSYRPRLGPLGDLTNTVAEVMKHHGKRVELYKRYDELRLRTYNCDASGITAAGNVIASYATLGLAVPVVRHCQFERFESAAEWKVPTHYDAEQFEKTYALTGYYDRIKVLPRFSDNALLDSWHQQIDQITNQNQPVRSRFLQTLAATFGG